MLNDQAREEIAFIRRVVEEGASYATARGTDMLVWGILVALGYVASYAFLRGWLPIAPRGIWTVCIGLGWAFSLRRIVGGGQDFPIRRPMAQALAMLWLGCGVSITTLVIAALASGAAREGWLDAVVAGLLGVGFFASASLTNFAWLRWVALAWWIGEIALFVLRHSAGKLLLAAALMLALLAGPGLLLLRRDPARAR